MGETTHTPRTPGTGSPVCLDTLRAQSMDDDVLALRLLDTLARQAERDLAALAQLDPAADAPRLAALAHALKGAAGAVGAHPVMHAARAADDAARTTAAAVPDALAALRAELRRLLDALPDLRRTLAGAQPHSTAPERP